jgi:hypothetical protein
MVNALGNFDLGEAVRAVEALDDQPFLEVR